MSILDNVIILLLIVGAFIAGLKLADHYHYREERMREYHQRYSAYKAMTGNTGEPYVQHPVQQPLGKEFADKLKAHGRAVQKLRV